MSVVELFVVPWLGDGGSASIPKSAARSATSTRASGTSSGGSIRWEMDVC
jgi:hypothetical protein